MAEDNNPNKPPTSRERLLHARRDFWRQHLKSAQPGVDTSPEDKPNDHPLTRG